MQRYLNEGKVRFAIMARPKTVEDFLVQVDTIRQNRILREDSIPDLSFRLVECRSCGDNYGSDLSVLTEGHCPACAEEKFYNSYKLLTDETVNRNRDPRGIIGTPAPTVPFSEKDYHGDHSIETR